VFNVGSISKQFTAAAIVLLARDGKLSLDDEVATTYRKFPTSPSAWARSNPPASSDFRSLSSKQTNLGPFSTAVKNGPCYFLWFTASWVVSTRQKRVE
jgi:hypothetical protein